MYTAQQIIAKLGIQDADPEIQDRALQNVANAVANRIFLAISERLNEKDLAQLSDMIDQKKDDDIERFVADRITNFDDFKQRIEQETIDEIAKNTALVSDQAQAISSEKLSI